MPKPDHPWPIKTLALYVALGLCWLGFAVWLAPPMLLAENPGIALAAVQKHIGGVPAPFQSRGILNRWREYARAFLIALGLHLTIVLFVRRYDERSSQREPPPGRIASDRLNQWLLTLAFVFLAVAVWTGPRHDYFFYLQMWHAVRQGHDPWFLVAGRDGQVPLNAYGPLFNLLAGLAWLNPLAPKLLFAYAYLWFAIRQIKEFTARRGTSGGATFTIMVLLWNPFPWVEIAIRGHFDVLVALLCLGAVRARNLGRDGVAGTCLACGALLKFFPVVLIPFLALERSRVRPRFVAFAIATIALGLALSFSVWGLSTLTPLAFAATRSSTGLSIFGFIRGRYSPLYGIVSGSTIDSMAPFIMGLALLRAWSWFRVRQPDLETGAVVAAVTTVLFYQTGYPQYQMVPFVLGAHWVLGHWDGLKGRRASVIGAACYFGWLAAFDLYYAFIDEAATAYYWPLVRDTACLPSFLAGCAFLAAVISSAAQGRRGQSSSSSDESS